MFLEHSAFMMFEECVLKYVLFLCMYVYVYIYTHILAMKIMFLSDLL